MEPDIVSIKCLSRYTCSWCYTIRKRHHFMQGLHTRLCGSRVLVSYVNEWRSGWGLRWTWWIWTHPTKWTATPTQLQPVVTAKWENASLWLLTISIARRVKQTKSGFLCYILSTDKEFKNVKPSVSHTTCTGLNGLVEASLSLLVETCRIYSFY